MSYSVDWITKVISIPTADLTLVSGTRYSLTMSDFLAEVRRLEWSFTDGLWADAIVDHTNTRFDFAGANYAPFDDLINGYTIQFTGVATRVDLLGSNNDLIDVLIATGVSIVPSNSAGLQIVNVGSGMLPEESQQLAEIHGGTLREIWIDETFPTNGNFGYQQEPFNLWADAIDFAETSFNIKTLAILTDATFDRNIKNFEIRGVGFPTIDLNEQDCDKTTIRRCNITGIHLGQLLVEDAGIQGVTGEVLAQRVAIGGFYKVRGGSFSILTGVAPLIPGAPWTLDLGISDTASIVGMADLSGGVVLDNIEIGDTVHIHIAQGQITINASCTGGNIVITGSALIIDNSTGSTVNIDAVDHVLVFNHPMENGETFEDQIRLQRANAAGKINQAADGSYVIRDAADTKDRIVGDDSVNNGRDITAVDGT